MDILKLLNLAGLNGPALKKALEAARDKFPDLAPEIDPILEQVDSALSPEAQVNLAVVLIRELKDVGSLHFHPTPHSGDGI